MKPFTMTVEKAFLNVALFTRAWIETLFSSSVPFVYPVALFTRAWIETNSATYSTRKVCVALFTRAWIETLISQYFVNVDISRPLYEGVD